MRQLEDRDGLHQLLGLRLQAACRRCTLLDQRRVLLRVLIHQRDRFADLGNARALLGAGRTDLAHDVVDAADGADHFGHGGARTVYQAGALCHPLHTGGNQALDLLGGFCTAPGQVAHFAGHDGKAPALFPGAGGFHRRVQRQNIGLEGDAINHTDDVGNALTGFVDAVHGGHHFFHHMPTFLGDLAGVDRQLVGLACVVGVLAHRAAKLLHGGCGLFQRAGLLLSAHGQVVIALRNFLAGQGHAFGTGVYVLHNQRHVGAHAFQPVQHAVAVARGGFGRSTQIARRHFLGEGQQLGGLCPQLLQDAARDGKPNPQQHDGDEQRSANHPLQAGGENGIQGIDVHARADHPAPGLEPHDVGDFFNWHLAARFGPQIAVVARTVLLDDVHKIHKQLAACGVAHAGDILTVELWPHRVHHHARGHVVDPEIFVAAVAQLGQGLQGLLLGLLLRERALGGQVVVVLDQAVGDFHGLPHSVFALLHEQFTLGITEVQGNTQHQERG